MTTDVCIWCHRKVTVPANHNPASELVCGKECKTKETWFRLQYSDEQIAKRCLQVHQVDLTRYKPPPIKRR